jgi:serine phosphatase RsbU (regulator of sigma subunit)
MKAEQDRLAYDLEAARQVQQSLLPSALPEVPGLDVAVRYEPMGAVGGDMYDFLPTSAPATGFVLADVSGHSLPAALLVAAARGALYEALNLPPAQMMARVNDHIARQSGKDRFVTMVYLRIDPERDVANWTNAGHPYPILLRGGRPPQVLEGHGIVLGVMPGSRYEEFTCALEAGDVLLLYSDGLVERDRPDGKVTGITDFVAALESISVGQRAEAIADEVLACSACLGAVRDDVALIVVRVTGHIPETNAPDAVRSRGREILPASGSSSGIE